MTVGYFAIVLPYEGAMLDEGSVVFARDRQEAEMKVTQELANQEPETDTIEDLISLYCLHEDGRISYPRVETDINIHVRIAEEKEVKK